MMLYEVLLKPNNLEYSLTAEPVLKISMLGIDAEVLVYNYARMPILRGRVLLSQLSR
jgi:hypothetical protein